MPPKKKKDIKALEELVKDLQAQLAETKRAKDRTNRVTHQCRCTDYDGFALQSVFMNQMRQFGDKMLQVCDTAGSAPVT